MVQKITQTSSEILPNLSEIQLAYPNLNPGLIKQYRSDFANSLYGKGRLVVIVGPCSLIGKESDLEYAQKLAELREKYTDDLLIVMRANPEKPRTAIGWEGALVEPLPGETSTMTERINHFRKLYLNILDLGLPIATEFVFTDLSSYYLADLVTTGWIGARTTKSPDHRKLAAHLGYMPIGFKNATDGNIQCAVNGILASQNTVAARIMNELGQMTWGNPVGNSGGYLILRGGTINGPNYGYDSLVEAKGKLSAAKLSTRSIVDCNHLNSGKNAEVQPKIVGKLLEIKNTSSDLFCGLMIESNLVDGEQDITSSNLFYGQSVTDGCLGWKKTAKLLEKIALAEKNRTY